MKQLSNSFDYFFLQPEAPRSLIPSAQGYVPTSISSTKRDYIPTVANTLSAIVQSYLGISCRLRHFWMPTVFFPIPLPYLFVFGHKKELVIYVQVYARKLGIIPEFVINSLVEMQEMV